MHLSKNPPIMDLTLNEQGIYEVNEKTYRVEIGEEISALELKLIILFNQIFTPP